MKRFFASLLSLSIILVFFLSTSASSVFIAFSCVDTRNELMESEYPLVSYPSQMFASSVLCPVIVNENNYNLLSSSFLFDNIVKSMTIGNIYLLKYNQDGDLYSFLLTEGNFSCYYNHNQFVYAVNNGKDIYRYNITNGYGSFITSAENEIEMIYGYDNLVFYSSCGSVYMCPANGGVAKEIYHNSDMISFYPVTSKVVRISVSNTFYDTCIEHQYTDASSYYNWFLSQKTEARHSSSGEKAVEFLTNNSVEDFLTVFEEIPHFSCFYVDFVENTISNNFEYTSECLNLYNDFVAVVDSFSASVDNDIPSRVVSRTYNTGDYFSQTGTECTCHNGNCSYSGGCDCKVCDGGIQCAGYARFVFREDNGIGYTSGHNVSSSAYPSVIGNNAETIAFFTSLHPTVYYWYSSPTTSNHKVAITSASSTGINICQANVGGKCRVSNGDYKSYASMAGMNPSSIVEYTSCTALARWVVYNAAYHCHRCKYCGGFVGPYQTHSVNATETLCTVCGYTGPFVYIHD